MKKTILLLLVSTFAASCINLNGQLNVEQTMTVKKKGGFLNLKMKNVELAPGAYRADLKINNQQSFTLKLRSDKDGEKDILIPIKSENEFRLPLNGAVRISGKEIAQPFDLNGTISTDFSESAITRTTEDCTVSRTERHCDKVCATVGGDARRPVVRCDIICRDVLVSFPGRRLVDYHYRYTNRVLDVAFNDIESKSQLATFSARGVESDRINDYYGECR